MIRQRGDHAGLHCFTDAAIARNCCPRWSGNWLMPAFNSITVDGDTSDGDSFGMHRHPPGGPCARIDTLDSAAGQQLVKRSSRWHVNWQAIDARDGEARRSSSPPRIEGRRQRG